jgi:hypothetical protein
MTAASAGRSGGLSIVPGMSARLKHQACRAPQAAVDERAGCDWGGRKNYAMGEAAGGARPSSPCVAISRVSQGKSDCCPAAGCQWCPWVSRNCRVLDCPVVCVFAGRMRCTRLACECRATRSTFGVRSRQLPRLSDLSLSNDSRTNPDWFRATVTSTNSAMPPRAERLRAATARTTDSSEPARCCSCDRAIPDADTVVYRYSYWLVRHPPPHLPTTPAGFSPIMGGGECRNWQQSTRLHTIFHKS